MQIGKGKVEVVAVAVYDFFHIIEIFNISKNDLRQCPDSLSPVALFRFQSPKRCLKVL